jgi:aminoglycoside phosphotransferase (APT) family kinase protein
VKTLPDSPNIEHLRRQAKDLLTGLRDSDPATTLADAQASLASQYGFRGWPELKAEVDRRQGGADVGDPALARAIAERFGLGAVTGGLRSLARPDDMGRRWSLDTGSGRWAVRTVDAVYPPTDGEPDFALQEAAARAGVVLPPPVRSTGGRVIEEIAGNRWRAYEWPHSGPPLSAPVGAAACAEVGRILATVHGLALPADRLCGWHSIRLNPASWADLAAKAPAWAHLIDGALAALTNLDRLSLVEGAHEPPVFTHNSLIPGNVRLGSDRGLVVSGWEHAAGQPPSWELGEALSHWTVDPNGGVNVAGARALLSGYREVAGALPPVSEAMFRGTAISSANYVAGQIELALSTGDGEDDRTVRHLLTHLPDRTAFDTLLDVAS